VSGETLAARQDAVRAMTASTREIADRLAPRFARSEAHEVVITGGGSTYPDVVAEELGRPWSLPKPVRVVLRSGAYITHDHGIYERGSPFGMRAAPGAPHLEPAIEVWAPVLSAPEPGLAIAGAGRRDLPVDQDLPVVIKVRGDDGIVRPAGPGFAVARLNDQHAFIELADEASLAVGDLVAFGISHPCTAFQLWREAIVVDEQDRILEVYELRF
jgi:D-serine deaminase-like pyridoxal phosphate-dependent protein